MNIKIDVNINLENIEPIIKKMAKIFNGTSNIYTKNCDNHPLEMVEDIKGINNQSISKISSNDLKGVMANLSHMGRAKEVKEILLKYNASRLNEVNEKDMDYVYSELRNLLNS